MSKTQWFTVVLVAVCTCTLTLGVFWPTSLVAREERTQAKTPPTVLEAGKARITVTANEKAIEAGKVAEFTLHALNSGSEACEVELNMSLQSPGVISPMSRMIPVPQEVWSKKLVLKLQPGQEVTQVIKTELEPNPAAQYTLSLGTGQKQIQAWTIAPKGIVMPNGSLVNLQAMANAADAGQENSPTPQADAEVEVVARNSSIDE